MLYTLQLIYLPGDNDIDHLQSVSEKDSFLLGT